MNQIVQECFEYKIFVKKPSKAHMKWFKEAFDFDYPSDYDKLDPKLVKELQKAIKMKKKDVEFNKRMGQQRLKRGYSDSDVWNIDYWFIKTVKPMLLQLRKNHHGFPVFIETEYLSKINMSLAEFNNWPNDKDSEEYKLRETIIELSDKRWVNILTEMIELLSEMNEETCSMKNPYEKQLYSYYRKFDKKYPDKDVLKTDKELEEEKRTNTWLYIGPERDPDFGSDYEETFKNYYEYEQQIEQYRDKCKNKFFEMFSKYFWNLGD